MGNILRLGKWLAPLIEEIKVLLISSPLMAMPLVFKGTQKSLPLNSQEIASRRASPALDGLSGKYAAEL